MTSPTGEQSTCPNHADLDDTEIGFSYLGELPVYNEFMNEFAGACAKMDQGANKTKISDDILKTLETVETRASATSAGNDVVELPPDLFENDRHIPVPAAWHDWTVMFPEAMKTVHEHTRQTTSSFTSTAGAAASRQDQKASSQAESSHMAMEGKPMRIQAEQVSRLASGDALSDSSGTRTEQPGDPDTEDGGVGTSKRTTDAKVARSGDFRGFRKGFLLR